MGLLALFNYIEIFVNSSLKVTKKFGYGHLKNSGERSRAILTLLFHMMPMGSKQALPECHKLECKNKEDKLQSSSSLKQEGIELWFLVCSFSLWTFISFINMMPLGSKLAPPRWSQVGTIRTKKVEFILWGKLLRWAIQGHHGPLVFYISLLKYRLFMNCLCNFSINCMLHFFS